MKNMKRALALLLCLVMVLSYVPGLANAADGAANLSMSLSTTEVNIGDEFTITVSYGDMKISSIGCPLSFDKTLVEFVSAVGCDPEAPEDVGLCAKKTFAYGEISTPEEANAIGQVGFAVAGMREVSYGECDIYTATFRAIGSGTVTFTLTEDSSGTDGFKGVAQVATVVIEDASEPSCAHPTTKIVSNGNGTHNVVCADTTCGAIVTENVNCTGTDDGNCTTAVTCECGYVITAAKTSHTGGTATCTAMAKCADCGTEYGNLGDHSYGELISAQEAVHTEEELKAGVAAYYQCSVCSKYFTESKDETTLEALTGETPAHAEDPSTTTIETESASCTEEGKTVTKTFCSCGLLLNSTTTPADPLGHTWGTTTYDWSADYNTCTATRVCATDPNHTETETVNTTSEINTPGTCTSEEVCTYTADFTADWAADQTQEVTGEMDPTSHAGEPSYEYVDEDFHKVTCSACGVEVYETHDWYNEFCSCGRCLIRVYFCDVSYDPDGEPGTDWMGMYGHCGTDFTDTRKLYPVNGYEKIGFRYWNLDTGESYEAQDIEYLTIPAEYVTEYYNALLEGKSSLIMMQVYAYNDLFIDLNGGSLTDEAEEEYGSRYDSEKNVIILPLHSMMASLPLIQYEGVIVRDGYELTGFYDSSKDTTYALTDELTSTEATTLVAQWECLHSTTTAVDNGETHIVVCGTCGEISESNVDHTYDETTHECVCGASAHLFEEADRKDPTCTEGGYFIYACDCGAQQRGVIDALGHFRTQNNKGDGTHYAMCCVCLETLGDPVPHTYDETTHECECGDVEKFLLRVYGLVGDVLLEELVSYGTGLYDYVKDLVCDSVPMETETQIGYLVFTEWTDYDYVAIDEDFTMPATDLEVYSNGAFTGWIKYDHIDGWVYEVMSQIQKTGWTEIDGAWYYLNPETGIRAEGMTRVPYPTVEINGITYAADAEAVAYCASKGTTFIDATEAWFLFGEDGKFSYETIGVVGDHYYVNGMQTWHPGLVEFAPDNYYFIGDVVNGGNIGANGDTYITKNNGNATFAIGEIYNFVNGKLSGAHGVVDGKYYQNSKLMMGYGLVKTDNGFIFVRSSGELATGKYYITNVKNYTGTELGYGYGVTFGADGYAINGIHDGKYYVNGLVAYGAGAVKTDAGYIYVRSNGVVVKNKTYWITTVGETGLVAKQYTFDANGIMQNPEFVAEQLNGIHNGYYYENGNIVYGAGLIEYNGGYIYVRSNGMVATGKYWVTNANDLMESNYYTFGEDGMMIN